MVAFYTPGRLTEHCGAAIGKEKLGTPTIYRSFSPPCIKYKHDCLATPLELGSPNLPPPGVYQDPKKAEDQTADKVSVHCISGHTCTELQVAGCMLAIVTVSLDC